MIKRNRTKQTAAQRLAEKKRWTPVRKGDVYCSPACGHSCTHAEYKEAKDAAKVLAERLGPGWKPHVWENCGWHFEAIKGTAEMIGSNPTCGKPHYTLFVNSVVQLVVESGPDPVKLLRKGLKQASAAVERMQMDVDMISCDTTPVRASPG